jgi:hypothetical protein
VLELAKVTDTIVSSEELMKEPSDDDKPAA